ncbi:putative SOS response-associated peptidase YedK [Mesorhizobium jarvisii]
MPKAAMFNARIEGIDTAAAFQDVFKSKRCLIPADGFYEWTISLAGGKKDPWHIYLPDYAPFSFVGLWAYNTNLDVASCTIIPSRPASRMKNPRPAAGNPRPGLLRRMARPGDAEGI